MPKSLFEERDKNILKSKIILYLMVFFALSFPFILYYLTNDFFISFMLGGIGALYYISNIRNGIKVTFESMNAKKLKEEDLKELKLKQFKNLVEELRIASGYDGEIDLYLIDHDSINAMAISRGKKAAIAITRGALEKLNREELSGVIGHEMSHIINADSELKLTAYLTMGVLLTYANFMIRGFGSSNRKKGGAFLILLAIAISIIAYVLSVFMFFAISRKREQLADVEAVRFNRNKNALISALKKIKQNSKLEVSETASSLFFANPLNPKTSSALLGLFRTHPPLDERIKYLEQI